jgi:hypothetical protein
MGEPAEYDDIFISQISLLLPQIAGECDHISPFLSIFYHLLPYHIKTTLLKYSK